MNGLKCLFFSWTERSTHETVIAIHYIDILKNMLITRLFSFAVFLIYSSGKLKISSTKVYAPQDE